jgi:hypothetical protein
MDVDALKYNNNCFNCGEPGHLRRNCPKPLKGQINMHNLMFNLTDRQYQALAESLALRVRHRLGKTRGVMVTGHAGMVTVSSPSLLPYTANPHPQ